MDDYLISCEVYTIGSLELVYKNTRNDILGHNGYAMARHAVESPGFVELVLVDNMGDDPRRKHNAREVFARFDTLDNLLLFKLSHG